MGEWNLILETDSGDPNLHVFYILFNDGIASKARDRRRQQTDEGWSQMIVMVKQVPMWPKFPIIRPRVEGKSRKKTSTRKRESNLGQQDQQQ